jgi:hypothetical protein
MSEMDGPGMNAVQGLVPYGDEAGVQDQEGAYSGAAQPVQDEEAGEMEKRDVLSVTLLDCARNMAEAANLCRASNDADKAYDFARAAHELTKAHIALDPLEERDDAEQSTGFSGPSD